MIVNIISTGSAGNLYELIDNKGNCIILEAGEPRSKYMKYREGLQPPEMCIISHNHQDHSGYRNDYKALMDVHEWKHTARSENFKAFGYKVEHGGVLNYAYLIKLIQDNEFLFFATDLEWHDETIKPILKDIKKYKVTNFLIECNFNDYLYHLADTEKRIGCDRHFSDNDLVRFLKKSKAVNPKVITIHGSNRLSADSYTKKYIGGKLPTATIAVGIGAKKGVKNLFKL